MYKDKYSQSYGFSSSHVWLWELDHKEGWTQRIDAFELWCWRRLLWLPWTARRAKPMKPILNMFRRTDASAEMPVFWPPDAKSQIIRKDLDAGKDWRQEKGTTEDEIVERHHRLNAHEFEQALEAGEGQGSLVCCSPWGHRESHRTERLNNKNVLISFNTNYYVIQRQLFEIRYK